MNSSSLRRRRALVTTSWLTLSAAVAAFPGAAYAQGSSAPAQPQTGTTPTPVVQQPNSVPVEQGSTTSSQPQPNRADELIADPVNQATNPAEAQAAGEIVVTGTRGSLQSALARRRNAGTVADSIVAEDIAQFPDKNIGEALQRITGVQIERDGGEGSQVSIRGVEPDLNRVEINGVSLLGQNFDTINPGARTVDFREVASELVSSIDVFKGFTADMTEGGVGGTVSIRTRRPLELRRPFLAVTGSMQHLDVADSWRPRGNITGGTKLLNDRLGVIVNVTYDNNNTRTDLIRNTDWVRYFGNSTQTDINNDAVRITPNPNFDAITTPVGCNTIPTSVTTPGQRRADCLQQFAEFVPRIPRYSIQERNDERISAMATVQYAVTDNFDVYAEYQRNRRENQYSDYHFQVDITAIARIAGASTGTGICTAPAGTPPPACTVDEDGNLIDFWTAPTATGATAGASNVLQLGHRDFALTQDSDYRTIGFNWDRETVRVSGLAVRSRAETVSNSQQLLLMGIIPSIHVSLDPENGNPTFQFPTADDPTDPDTFANPSIAVPNGARRLQYAWRPEQLDVGEDQYKIDADFDIPSSFLTMVEVGGQYRNTTYLRYGGATDPGFNSEGIFVHAPGQTVEVRVGPTHVPWVPPTAGTPSSRPVTWTQSMFNDFLSQATQTTPGTFFNHPDVEGFPAQWLVPNYNNFGSFFDTSFFNHDLMREDCLTQNASGEAICAAQPPTHDVEEQIWAGYLKGNFEFEAAGIPFSGNVGMRYARTRNIARGFLRQEPDSGDEVFDLISIERTYDDWLPSFNLMAGIIPDQLILRLGAARVMARPRPQNLVPNLTCGVDEVGADLTTCTGGNPDLDPYRANQYDVSIGWYPNRDTLLSVSVFHKDIKSYVVEGVTQFDVDYFGTGELVDVTQPINARGARITGVEFTAQTAFTFLPSPLDGFGAQFNYTFQDADNVGLFNNITQEPLPFPGLSRHSWNLVGYYDKDWLNVRVAYNARSRYLRDAQERSGNPAFADATGYLDAKATFRFANLPGSPSFFIEGKNLTRETERRTAGSIRLQDFSYSGRRFFVGASFRF